MPHFPVRSPVAPALWILLCAYLNCAGWVLSLFGSLNPSGYLVALAIGIAILVVLWRKLFPNAVSCQAICRKQRGRFGRLFPLGFLAVAMLALLGGILHPPSNPDALTQRIPRVLNWLAEGSWYWIPKVSTSFNTRASGFEWLMAPMLSLLRTDRFVFILNSASFLLMPGLVFSLFWRLGVARRAAWHWMWIVPMGYCYVLQAGSIGNDAVGAVFALAALDFALRARSSGKLLDAALSVLAAALLTSSKTSNLPLLLPWLIAFWPSLRLLWRRPLATAVVTVMGLLASFAPTAALNHYYVQDWLGGRHELPPEVWNAKPHIAFVGNVLNLGVQNLVPPVFPFANWWNENARKALPEGLAAEMRKSFEPGGAGLKVPEIQIEGGAALGSAVTLLLVVSCLAALKTGRKRKAPGPAPEPWHLKLVRWSSLVSVSVYLLKSTLSASGRILAPYYGVLLPVMLTWRGHSEVVRQRWWRSLSLLVFVVAAGLLVLNPGRPLWPAVSILQRVAPAEGNGGLAKVRQVYESYAVRWDALASVRDGLPSSETKIGFMTFITTTTLETSLWRPLGSRRVVPVRPEDTLEILRGQELRYIVIGADTLESSVRDMPFSEWVSAWAKHRQGRVVHQATAPLKASSPPSPFLVVDLGPAEPIHSQTTRSVDPGDEPRNRLKLSRDYFRQSPLPTQNSLIANR